MFFNSVKRHVESRVICALFGGVQSRLGHNPKPTPTDPSAAARARLHTERNQPAIHSTTARGQCTGSKEPSHLPQAVECPLHPASSSSSLANACLPLLANDTHHRPTTTGNSSSSNLLRPTTWACRPLPTPVDFAADLPLLRCSSSTTCHLVKCRRISLLLRLILSLDNSRCSSSHLLRPAE